MSFLVGDLLELRPFNAFIRNVCLELYYNPQA